MDNFCAASAPIWKFAGQIVQVFKIIIPAILVIIGVIGLGRAVLAADDKDIKKEVMSFIKKCIIAICVFFIPYVVSALFSAVGGEADYVDCISCITNPKNCDTSKAVTN